MRILAATLAIVAVSTTVAAGATDPRAEKIRLRPADVALAKRSVLRQSDVGPDWNRIPTKRLPNGQFACASFKPDFSRFTVTGHAWASFQLPSPAGAQMDSMVAVFKTKAQAVADFRLGARRELAGCFAQQLRQAFRRYPAGVKGRLLSSKMVTAPRFGERSAAYAITARLSGNGTSLPLFVDVLAIQRGRSIAALYFTGVGSRLPSQRYFASTITGRLR